MITYKFRIYPTRQQQTKLWQHSGLLNQVYNYFLEQRETAFAEGKRVSRRHQQSELVQLKKDIPDLKAIHSQVLQQIPLRLDRAYTMYFKHKDNPELRWGNPNFRSRRRFFNITYPQSGYELHKDYFYTKAYGRIKLLQHTPVEGKVKQVTLTEQDGCWYCCIVTDYSKVACLNNTSMIGLDLGITNLVATSSGEIIRNLYHASYFEKQIAKLQSYRDTKCLKYSRRYRYLSKVIKRLYGAVRRKTNDFLHKVSHYLTNTFDTIIIEDLNLKQMSESIKTWLARGLRASCLSRFVQYLQYKAYRLIKVNPAYTSKMCNVCGKMHDMPLSKRVMQCSCGNVVDRDVNAAKNIICLGQAYLLDPNLAGCTVVEVNSAREALSVREG